MPPEWVGYAECAKADVASDIFFPSDSLEGSLDRDAAVLVCRRCSVKNECLQYALEKNCDGVWGGTTKVQRRHMKIGSMPRRSTH